MNIGPQYQAGMELALNDSYDVLVDKKGYANWRQSIRVDQITKNLQVSLKKHTQKTML